MVDAYLPVLADLVFTAEEQDAIKAALETAAPWDWKPGAPQQDALQSAKNKIRVFQLLRHKGRCCYCRLNLHGGGHFLQDREHVLPKSKPHYKPYSFSTWNIGVSCKRCNLEIKRADDTFVIEKSDANHYEMSENYTLVHPNFDCYESHLRRFEYGGGPMSLVIFSLKHGSDKGVAMRKYFRLGELEVDSFDQAQGLDQEDVEFGIAVQVRDLAKKWGQPSPSLPQD